MKGLRESAPSTDRASTGNLRNPCNFLEGEQRSSPEAPCGACANMGMMAHSPHISPSIQGRSNVNYQHLTAEANCPLGLFSLLLSDQRRNDNQRTKWLPSGCTLSSIVPVLQNVFLGSCDLWINHFCSSGKDNSLTHITTILPQ